MILSSSNLTRAYSITRSERLRGCRWLCLLSQALSGSPTVVEGVTYTVGESNFKFSWFEKDELPLQYAAKRSAEAVAGNNALGVDEASAVAGYYETPRLLPELHRHTLDVAIGYKTDKLHEVKPQRPTCNLDTCFVKRHETLRNENPMSGAVFIDKFSNQPGRGSKQVVIYTVAPRPVTKKSGELKAKGEYLNEITQTGENFVQALNQHNTRASETPLEIVQVPLMVNKDDQHPDVSLNEVAAACVTGIAAKASISSPLFCFTHPAYRSILAAQTGNGAAGDTPDALDAKTKQDIAEEKTLIAGVSR